MIVAPKDSESPVDESLLPPSPGDRIVGNMKVDQPGDALIASMRTALEGKATLPPSGFDNPYEYCYRNALLVVLLCSDRLMSYIQHHHIKRIQELKTTSITDGGSYLPSDYVDVFTMMYELFRAYWSPQRNQHSLGGAMRKFWKWIDSPACRIGLVLQVWPITGQQDCVEFLNHLLAVLRLQSLGGDALDTSPSRHPEVRNVEHLLYKITKVLKRCTECRNKNNVKHVVDNDSSYCWEVPVLRDGIEDLRTLLPQGHGKQLSDGPWYCEDCYSSWEENVKPFYDHTSAEYKKHIRERFEKGKSDYEWHSIAQLPEVLFMQFKIFAGDNVKRDVQIGLLENIDLAEYVDRDNYEGSTRFRLKGVIRHLGSSSRSGHYVCYVLVDGQWYYINDQDVEKKSWREVNRVSWGRYNSPETPYLLMWEKIYESEAEEQTSPRKPASLPSQSSPIASSPIEMSSSESSPKQSSPINISSSESLFGSSSSSQRSESRASEGQGIGSPAVDSTNSDEDISDEDGSGHETSGHETSERETPERETSERETPERESSDHESSEDNDSDSDSSDGPDPGSNPASTKYVADAGIQTLSRLHDAPAAIRSSINFDGQSLLEIHPVPHMPDLMERIYAAPEGGERPSNAIDVRHRGRLEIFQMEDGHPPVSFQLWKVLRRGYLHWEDIIDKDEFGKKQKQAWYNFYNNVHTSYGPGVHPVEMIPKWQWKQREADRRKNEYWARKAEEEKAEQHNSSGKQKGKVEKPKVRKISIFQTPMVQWVAADKKPTGKSKKPKSPPSKLTLKQPHHNTATDRKTPPPTTLRPTYTTRGTSPKTPSPKTPSPTTPRPKYTTRGTSPKTPSPKTPSPKMPSPKTPRPEYKNEQTQVHPTDIDVSDDDQSSSSYATAPSPAKSDSKSPSPRQSPTGSGASSSSLSSPPSSSSSLSSPPKSPAPAPKRRGGSSKAITQPTRVMPERKVKPKHPGLVHDAAKKEVGKTTAPKKPTAGKKGVKKTGAGGRKGMGKKTLAKKVPVVSDDADSGSGITKRSTKKRKRADGGQQGEVAKEADKGKDDEEGRGGRKRLKKNKDGTWSRG